MADNGFYGIVVYNKTICTEVIELHRPDGEGNKSFGRRLVEIRKKYGEESILFSAELRTPITRKSLLNMVGENLR